MIATFGKDFGWSVMSLILLQIFLRPPQVTPENGDVQASWILKQRVEWSILWFQGWRRKYENFQSESARNQCWQRSYVLLLLRFQSPFVTMGMWLSWSSTGIYVIWSSEVAITKQWATPLINCNMTQKATAYVFFVISFRKRLWLISQCISPMYNSSYV